MLNIMGPVIICYAVTLSSSWRCHKETPVVSREKKPGKVKAAQDACLGQALILVLLIHFPIRFLYICTPKLTMFPFRESLPSKPCFGLCLLLTQLSLGQLLQPTFLSLDPCQLQNGSCLPHP